MLKKLFEKYPIIPTVLILLAIVLAIWWLSQPVEIIYDPDAPPLWIDDDPEGGYFPRN